MVEFALTILNDSLRPLWADIRWLKIRVFEISNSDLVSNAFSQPHSHGGFATARRILDPVSFCVVLATHNNETMASGGGGEEIARVAYYPRRPGKNFPKCIVQCDGFFSSILKRLH